MNRATPQMRSIAKRLMVAEEGRINASTGDAPAGFHVTQSLTPHLATLVGLGGVRALYARALSLAGEEAAWLRELRVDEGGRPEGADALRPTLTPKEFNEGCVLFVAHVLGLLTAFIGPTLTSRLIGEIWPEIPSTHLNFGKEDRNEDAT